MDPITLIVTAVIAGAAAGLQDTAAEAVKDAYRKLKDLLTKRKVDVAPLERRPSSESKQGSLREDLKDLQGSEAIDEQLVEAARNLLALVKQHDPAAAAAVGVDLEKLDVGGSLTIKDITAHGSGLRGRDWKATGDVLIQGVNAGHERAQSTATPAEGPPRPL